MNPFILGFRAACRYIFVSFFIFINKVEKYTGQKRGILFFSGIILRDLSFDIILNDILISSLEIAEFFSTKNNKKSFSVIITFYNTIRSFETFIMRDTSSSKTLLFTSIAETRNYKYMRKT